MPAPVPSPSSFLVRFLRESRGSRWIRTGAVLGCLLGLATVGAEAKSKKKDQKEGKASSTLDLPIPVGHNAEGIKLPDYDEQGRLQMNFEIGSAYRIDQDHLKLSNLKIETYDDSGKPDMLIEMPVSLLDLKTRILSSVEPVIIHRSDFEVTGGNMTFDTETRQGKFNGPVRMLIFNRDGLEEADNEEAAKGGAGE